MDKNARNFWVETIIMVFFLLGIVAAYLRFPNPSLLFAGALGFTFYVAANIILSSR